jgi:Fur family transcriptional regulator, iron response regulator
MNESRLDDPRLAHGQIPVEIAPGSGDAPENGNAADGPPSGAGSRRDAPEIRTQGFGRNGCPWHDVQALLRQVKLRPTRQRMALGWLLFAKGGRHLTAEMLYEEAGRAKVAVSLATIYNTLHQFTTAGLLREVTVNGSKTYFDTNVSDHHHFFVENEHNLIDIPAAPDIIGKLPDVPEGYEISRVDVVVRLRRRRKA